MANGKILVVDDEARMRKLIRDFLTKAGYTVAEAADGKEAVEAFQKEGDVACIIMDVMMPRMDGYQATREIRRTSQVPIIMLTAKSEEQDELQGFELGIDEYVTKPFSPKALVARVDAILRRTSGELQGQGEPDRLEIAGIVMDKKGHTVTIDGKPLELSFKEYELLQYFMENNGIALSRDRILNNVWNYDYFGDARTIDTHVKKLRSKMGDKGELIKTIWGMGYKFEAPTGDNSST